MTISGALFQNGNDNVIIHCHRLLGSRRGKEVGGLLDAFIDEYDVITFDFRGHRASNWTSTLGGDEVLDLRAVIAFANSKGYRKIVVLGSGMGAAVAIRTAGIFKNMSALVAVNPSGFSRAAQPLIVRMVTDLAVSTEYGKVPIRLVTNTRLGAKYTSGYPIDLVAGVAPIPLLVVQSESDRYGSLARLHDAFGRANEPKQLIVVSGSLDGDDLLVSTLMEIRNWLRNVIPDRGQWPALSDYPESVRVVLTGDLPIPEVLILRDLYRKLCVSGQAAANPEIEIEKVLQRLREILSFYGYTASSFTVDHCDPPLNIRISIPRIRSVGIEGNRWVTDEYIRHVLKIEGDYYNAYELDAAVRRLSSEPSVQTASFELVTADSTGGQDGRAVDVHLTVVEQRPYRLELATKYTDIDKFFGVGVTWNEFNPSGMQLWGKVAIGVQNRDLLMSFGMARSFRRKGIRLSGRCFNDIKSRDDLECVYARQEVQETGGEIAAYYQIASTMDIDVAVFGKEFKAPVVSSGLPVQEGRALGAFVKLDLRGSLPRQDYPRFIWRHTLYYQGCRRGDMGDFAFDTCQLNLSGEVRPWGSHRAVTTLHYGWLLGDAPPQEHFSLGGMSTLPGYPDDAFVNTRMIRASQKIYLYASTWLDERSLLAPLRLITTFNTGTVWGDEERLEADDLKMDAGLELDYDAVLRLGIAVPLGPHRRDSPRVYIGWGAHVW